MLPHVLRVFPSLISRLSEILPLSYFNGIICLIPFFRQAFRSDLAGAPKVNFRKIAVRKSIWDLEFPEHFL